MKRSNRKASHKGMNWIRQEKRLAIYLRDGLACAYCGDSVENGAKLSLDHIITWSNNGTNDPSNLVTCCSRCNSSRGDRPMRTFAAGVATYLGVDVKGIVKHINATRKRTLPVAEAKDMIARRGSAARVLATMC
jgi:5-methylcytosine-specific restriction endonuclease McrA